MHQCYWMFFVILVAGVRRRDIMAFE